MPIRTATVPAPVRSLRSDMLAVYPIGDPHLGLMTWAPETGENWDLRKGLRVLEAAIVDLADKGTEAASAVLAPLGDVFHSDDDTNRTRRSGHVLDVDGRWVKIMKATIDLFVFGIDHLLTKHEHVTFICPPGNHDDYSAMMLSIALEKYFRKEPRVYIDSTPSHRYYHRFGKNLLVFTHGHTRKIQGLPALMSNERRADWGEVEHCHAFTGHVHNRALFEHGGVTIETTRTLAPKDRYAHEYGYLSDRDMHRVVFDAEGGEESRTIARAQTLIRRLAA